MGLVYFNFENLSTLFFYMFNNFTAWILYGLFLASFALIPKIRQYYAIKNFVLIFCISSFLYSAICLLIFYFLAFIMQSFNFIINGSITAIVSIYLIAGCFMGVVSSILFILICFLMPKNEVDAKSSGNQIKIVCIISLIHYILSPLFCLVFMFLRGRGY
ncbi:hypothetical protein BKN38_04845 [Helicobacter sp. CLO-3]|nr:hypothetical protein BA723_07525 [Helicobacter sp. CLO-3]OHU83916.1 hypothetical protein BKN38_04845 [Helicobacter sp. CLO-3]